jgi:hypothetical protein
MGPVIGTAWLIEVKDGTVTGDLDVDCDLPIKSGFLQLRFPFPSRRTLWLGCVSAAQPIRLNRPSTVELEQKRTGLCGQNL